MLLVVEAFSDNLVQLGYVVSGNVFLKPDRHSGTVELFCLGNSGVYYFFQSLADATNERWALGVKYFGLQDLCIIFMLDVFQC